MYNLFTTRNCVGIGRFFALKNLSHIKKLFYKLLFFFLLALIVPNLIWAQCTDSPAADIPDGVALGLLSGSHSSYVINVDSEGTLDNAGGAGMTSISSVCLAVEHPSSPEIDVFLTSPEGTTISLSLGNGVFDILFGCPVISNNLGDYSGVNPVELCFVDGAAQDITDYCGGADGVAGDWNPENSFDAFDGESPNGAWILSVEDNLLLTTGTFDSWSINFSNGDCEVTCNADGGTAAIVGGFDSSLCCSEQTQAEVSGQTTDSGYDVFWTLTSGSGGATTAADVTAGEDFGQGTSSDVLTYDCATRPAGTYSLTPYIATDGTNGTDVQVFDASTTIPNISLGGSLTLDVSDVPFDGTTTIDFDVVVGGSAVDLYIATYTSPNNPLIPLSINLDNRYNNLQSFTGNPNGTYALNFVAGVNLIFDPTNIDIVVTVRNIPAGYVDTDCSDFGTPITVTLLAPPTAGASSNSPICVGEMLSLMGMGGTAYTWSGPNSFSSGTQNPTINNVTTANAGTYIVTVTDGNDCTDTAETTVVVNDLPTATAGSNSPVCENETIGLTSGGGTSYTWEGPNGFDSNDQNPNISNAQNANAGTYTVTVSDGNSCTSTAETTVVVNPGTTAVVGNNSPVCAGETVNLTSSGGNSYTWAGPNSFSSNDQNPSISNAQSADAGTYTVTVTDGNDCSDTAETTVVVNEATATAGSNSPVCEGEDLNLTSSGGSSYAWAGPNSYTSTEQNPTIANFTAATNAGTYTVTVTDANNCTDTAETTVAEDNDPLCDPGGNCLIVVVAAPTGCNNTDNTYDLTLTITNPILIPAANGFNVYIDGMITAGSPYPYDAGLATIITIQDIDSQGDGVTLTTVEVEDVDDTNCDMTTTYLEPLLCYDPLNCLMVVAATPTACDATDNTYDLALVITNPILIPATTGFNIYINGVLHSGPHPYDGGLTTLYTVEGLASGGDGVTTTDVAVQDADDADCEASIAYLEPPLCFDPLNCGIIVVPTATACDGTDNTYDLDLLITNPLFVPTDAGYNVFINGVAQAGNPYAYDAGLTTSLSFTDLDSSGDGVTTSTVQIIDDGESDCSASNTFIEPAVCFDPTECLTTVTAVPTACDANDNTYDLTVTITNPVLIPAATGFNVYIAGTITAGSPYTYGVGLTTIITIEDLDSQGDGITAVSIAVEDVDNTDCNATSTFVEPALCFDPTNCLMAVVPVTTTCNAINNNYELTLTVTSPTLIPASTGFNVYINGVAQAGNPYAYSGLAATIITFDNLDANGDGVTSSTVVVEDADNTDCSASGDFIEPPVCFDPVNCNIAVAAVPTGCNDVDNTYDVTLTIVNPVLVSGAGGFNIYIDGTITEDSPYPYDAGINTILTIEDLDSQGDGVTLTDLVIEDADNTDCTAATTYIEPILCFDPLNCLMVVAAVPTACDATDNTYDLTLTITNPVLIPATTGFNIYINGVFYSGPHPYGANPATIYTINNLDSQGDGITTTDVAVQDADNADCEASFAYVEPPLCFDPLNCGILVVPTATTCDGVDNTYDLNLLITNPLTVPTTSGYNVFINGVAQAGNPYAYDAGLTTSLSFTDLDSSGDGVTTSTVQVIDEGESNCSASNTFIEPAVCFDPTECLTTVTAVPTACDANDNTYDLTVTITNPVLIPATTGFNVYIAGTITDDSPYAYDAGLTTIITIQDLDSQGDGITTVSIAVEDADNTDCNASSNFVEPAVCFDPTNCLMAVVPVATTCDAIDNSYDLTLTITNPTLIPAGTGFNVFINGVAQAGNPYPYSGIAATIITFDNLDANGDGVTSSTVLVQDADDTDCSASADFVEPPVCFDPVNCAIAVVPVAAACDAADNTYDLTLTITNPLLVPASGGFNVYIDGTVTDDSPYTYDAGVTTILTINDLDSDGDGVTQSTVIVEDADNTDCQASGTYFEPVTCFDPTNCTIAVVAVPTTCDDEDNTYNLTLTLTNPINIPATTGFNVLVNGVLQTGSPFSYDAGLATILTINDLDATGDGVQTSSVTVQDADETTCAASTTYVEPLICFDPDNCGMLVVPVATTCDAENNTYDLTLTITNPLLVPAQTGFNVYIDGTITAGSPYTYDAGLTTTLVLADLDSQGDGITLTDVMIEDVDDTDCTADGTFLEPQLCFDPVNCLLAVVPVATACDPNDNTYDLTLTITNPLLIPAQTGFNVYINGTITADSPYTYDAGLVTVLTLTDLDSSGDGVITSTAAVEDVDNTDCAASTDYVEPPICFDVQNCGLVVAAAPTACNALDNTYDLTLTITNPLLVPANTGFNVYINGTITDDSPYSYSGGLVTILTLNDLASNGDGVTLTDVAVEDVDDTDCAASSTYLEPIICFDPINCGMIVVPIPTTCDASDNTYDLILNITNPLLIPANTGFNVYINGTLQTGSPFAYQAGVSTSITLSDLDSQGDGVTASTIVVEDADDSDCSASANFIEPLTCFDPTNCLMTVTPVATACDATDNTYDLTLTITNPILIPATTGYNVYINGTLQTGSPFAYDAGVATVLTLTDLDSQGDGVTTSTVTVEDADDTTCAASNTFVEPPLCFDALNCGMLVVAAPTTCDPIDNSYDLLLTITNPLFVPLDDGFNVYINGVITAGSPYAYDLTLGTLVTLLTLNDLDTTGDGIETSTVTIEDAGENACTASVDYIEPAVCFDPVNCAIAAIAVASACDANDNTYDLTITITDPILIPAQNGFNVYINGTITDDSPYTYDNDITQTTILTIQDLDSQGDGVTTSTVTIEDVDNTDCSIATTFVEPPVCFDPNLCGLNVVPVATTCDPNDNTYDLTLTITNPLLVPLDAGFNVFINGVAQAGNPYTYDQTGLGLTTILNFNDLDSSGDGIVTSTVTIEDDGEEECATSNTYIEPITCLDPTNCLLAVVPVATTCDPIDNSYDLTLTITNPVSIPAATGFNVFINGVAQAGNPYSYDAGAVTLITVTNLDSSGDGIQTSTVLVQDADETTCAASNTYVEPPVCFDPINCGMLVVPVATTCDDTDNTYDLTLTITNPLLAPAENGFNVYINGTITDDSPYDYADGLVTVLGINDLDSNGDGVTFTDVVIEDVDDTDCTASGSYLEPLVCFDPLDCGIAVVPVASACDASDNTYSLTLTVTNPGLVPAENGFDVFINGVILPDSPYAYDAGLVTILTIDGLDSQGDGVTTTDVAVQDADNFNCAASATFIEPPLCFDPLNCGIIVAAVPTDCDGADNTYDLTVTITNPLFVSGTDGFNLLINGTVVGDSPYDYSGLAVTTVTLTDLDSQGDGITTSTITAQDVETPTCAANNTFIEPVICFDPLNCGIIVAAVATTCDASDNTYDLTLTITEPLLVGGTQGFEVFVDGTKVGDASYDYTGLGVTIVTISDLDSQGDGITTSLVTVQDIEEPDCNASITFVEPVLCFDPLNCGIIVAAVPTVCNPLDNSYDLLLTITNPLFVPGDGGFNVYINGVKTANSPYSYDVGLVTLLTIEDLDASGDGLPSSTVTIEDADETDCTASMDYIEPAACFGTACNNFAVIAAATDCNPVTNTYDVVVTVTNPELVNALGGNSQGFELYINGNLIGTYDYDLLGVASVVTATGISADETNGLTGSVTVIDLDADCTAAASYIEPVACFDLDCTGFAVVATATTCGSVANTYNVDVVVTNPNLLGLLGSNAEGFELYINGNLIDEYEYNGTTAGLLTTVTVNDIPYDEVNGLTGTVEVRDIDGDCVANSTYIEPIICLDLDCLGFAVVGIATECGTETNTYNLDVTVTNPNFLGLLGPDVEGFELFVNGTSYGIYDYTGGNGATTTIALSNVPFDESGDLTGTVSAEDANGDSGCVASSTFVEPVACLDLDCAGFAVVGTATTCGTIANSYNLDFIVTHPDLLGTLAESQGFELYVNGALIDTFEYANSTAGLVTTGTVENVIYDSNGGLTGTIEVRDLDGDCVANSTYLEPITCIDLDCIGLAAVAGTITCGTEVNTYDINVLVTNPNLVDQLGSDSQGFELFINTVSYGVYQYDGLAGLITNILVQGVEFDSAGGLTGTIEVVDQDADCNVSSTFLEPLVCFGNPCNGFAVAAVAGDCDDTTDTYDLTVTVTNPDVLDALGGTSQGFELTVNGTLLGTYDYDLAGATTIVTVNVAANPNDGLTGTVSAEDLDVGCTANSTYTEPIECFNLDCTGFAVVATTLECGTALNSYDLQVVVTNPALLGLLGSEAQGFELFVNGNLIGSFDYEGIVAGELTTITVENVPYDQVNGLTGTVEVRDLDNSTCVANSTFVEPIACLNLTCTGYNVTASATECGTVTNTYNVDITITNPNFLGLLGDDAEGYELSINGTSYGTFDYDAGATTSITINNVPFDTVGDLTGTVSIQDQNNTDCTASFTFVEPVACLDLDCVGFAVTATSTGCAAAINSYDLEVVVTNPDLVDVLGSNAQGFEIFVNGISYGTFDYEGAAGVLTTITVENVPYDSNGGLTGTVEATDLDEQCTVNSTYVEPIACLDLDCTGFAAVAGTITCGTAVNTYDLEVLVTNPNLITLLGSDAQGFELLINGNSVGIFPYDGIAGAVTSVTIEEVEFDATGGLTGTIEASDLDGDCTASSTFTEPLVCFGTACNNFAVSAVPTSDCDGTTNTYDLQVTVTNPEVLDVLGADSQGFELTVNGTVLGTYDYDLTGTTTVVTVTATSSGGTTGAVSVLDLDADCTAATTYAEPDCPFCTVSIDTNNITTTCASDGTYELTFTVTYNELVGTNGFDYSINGGTAINVAYDGSGSQSVTVEDLTGDGTSTVTIDIEDADDTTCSDTYSFTAPDCPVCDLSFTTTQQACQGNGTYNLLLNVTYSNTLTSTGFTYSVNGGTAVSVAYTGSGSQTVTVPNLVGDESSVTVVITDQENSGCTATQTYTAQNCPILCDFDASVSVMQSGGSPCQSDNTHTINLTVSYDSNIVGTQGFDYSIDGGATTNVAYDGSGLQIVQITGLASDGQNSIVSVSDVENEDICNASADYTAPVCPACSISVSGINSSCQFDGTYNLTFTVNYNETVGDNGFNYSVNGGTAVNVAYNGSGSQNVTVTGLDGNGAASTISVTDAQNLACGSGTVSYSAPNCPTCAISVSSVNSSCNSDGTFDLAFTVNYNTATGSTGFNYMVNGGTQVNVAYDGTGSQTVVVENLAGNGASGSIEVTDAQFPSCGSGSIAYTAPTCAVCDITVSASPTLADCNSDGTYNLTFTVEYNTLVGSQGFEYSLNGGTTTTVAYDGTGSQTVTVNNLSGNGTTTAISVNDVANTSCSGSTSFVAPNCPLCDLSINASQGVCQGDGTYDLALVVTYSNTASSTGFNYTVNGGAATTVNYDGSGQQTLTIENLVGDGASVTVVVTDLLNDDCTATTTYTSQVCTVVCDLDTDIDVVGTCQADDTFSITFTVTYGDNIGDNGFNYTIGSSVAVNVDYDGTGEQTITVDGIEGTGQTMSVTVIDADNSDCASSSSFAAPLCPPCEVSIGSDITASCNDDGTYDLTFTVNYNVNVGENGFSYSINGENNTSVSYDDSGSQTVVVTGLLGDGNDITIEVNDSDLTDCEGDTAVFTAPVCETCGIVVAVPDIVTECNGSGTYDLTFVVTYNELVGTNGFNYSLNGGASVNVAYDGTGSQSITVGGLIGNGSLATIEVTDGDDASCGSGVVNYQSPECELCTLSIIAGDITTECQEDGTYTLTFVLIYNDLVGNQGFSYSINGGASTVVEYDGSGEQTVVVTGLAGNGGTMSLEAVDVNDPACSTGFVSFDAPICDICSVQIVPDSFSTNCNSDGTFTLTFAVSYNDLVGDGGFNYTIGEATPVNVAYDESGEQTVTVTGLIGDGETVSIAVADANSTSCAGDSVDFEKPTCGVCDLNLSTTALACEANGTFDVELEVTYSNTVNSTGFTYSVNGGTAVNVFYNGTGVQTVLIEGLVGDESSVTIDVEDNANENCTATTTFTASNCPVLCGLDVSASVEAAAISCQPDNTYSVTLTVTYDETAGSQGFNYSINGGASTNVAYDDTGSQTVVVSGLDGDGSLVNVSVEDAENTTCSATTNYTAPACPACNINVALVSQDCQADGTNTLTFSVSYNESVGNLGFNYSVNGGVAVNVPYTSAIGVQTLVIEGMIGDGSDINIEVSDAQFDDCDGASLTFASAVCESCTLNVIATAEAETCIGDGTYTLELKVIYNELVGNSGFNYSINGGSSVSVDYDGSGFQVILIEGMIGNGDTFMVEVEDATNSDCGSSTVTTAPECELCNLIVSSNNVETECQEDGTYNLSFLVNYNSATGSAGFEYSIEGSAPMMVAYDGTGSQMITVTGLIGDGALNQTIEVSDVQFPDCAETANYTAPDCEEEQQPCSLSMNTVIGDCEDGIYDVTLEITYQNPKGSGFNYKVKNQASVFVEYDGSGFQTVNLSGLIGDGKAISIDVSDSANPDCSADAAFLAPFCLGDCKINARAERFCNDDGTFDLAIIVTYENVGNAGFEYIIDEGSPTHVLYDGSGVQIVLVNGLPIEGPPVAIDVYDLVQQSCDKEFSVTRPDCEEPECNLNVSVFPDEDCGVNNTYGALVVVDYTNVSGSSFTYIIDGEVAETVDYDGTGQQSIKVDDLTGDGGFVTIEVFDTDNPDCSAEATYTAPDCDDEVDCSIEVSAVVGLCEDDDTYDMTLVVSYDNVSGEGFNYALSDTEGNDLPLGVVEYDGSGLQTITLAGLAGNGNAIQVLVNDNLVTDCSSFITYDAPNCPEDVVEDCAINIESFSTGNCNSDGTYNLVFVVSHNEEAGNSGFNYSINGEGLTNVAYDAINNQTTVNVVLEGNGELVSISVADAENADCNDSIDDAFTAPVCGDCSLSASAFASVNCADDGTYSIVLIVDYENTVGDSFTYQIGEDTMGTVMYDNTGQQSVSISGLTPNAGEVSVLVTDTGDGSCTAITSYTSTNCENEVNCNLSLEGETGSTLEPAVICDGDGNYSVAFILDYEDTGSSEGFTYTFVDSNGEIVASGSGTYDGSGLQAFTVSGIVGFTSLDITAIFTDLGDANCTTTVGYVAPDCAGTVACTLNSAGICTLSLIEKKAAALEVCPLEGAQAEATGVILFDTSYELGYILYTDKFDPFGSILALNQTGQFFNDGSIPGVPLDEVIYVTSILLKAPFGSIIDEADECIQLGIPAEAIFLSKCNACATIASDEVICTSVGGNYQVAVFVGGGTAPYSVLSGGILTEDVPEGTILGFGPFNDSDNYSLVVTDANGCVQIISGDADLCQTLPVELIEFTGEVLQKGNLLKWITASEVNNDYFTLEHSLDGEHYEPIAKVDGQGTTSEVHSYDFLHKNAPIGLSYYRLSQTDFDGNRSAYSVITLLRKSDGFQLLNIRPIPSDSWVTISFMSMGDEDITFTIHSVDGRLIDVQKLSAKAGVNEHIIDISGYASGMYHLQLANGQEVINAKIMRE